MCLSHFPYFSVSIRMDGSCVVTKPQRRKITFHLTPFIAEWTYLFYLFFGVDVLFPSTLLLLLSVYCDVYVFVSISGLLKMQDALYRQWKQCHKCTDELLHFAVEGRAVKASSSSTTISIDSSCIKVDRVMHLRCGTFTIYTTDGDMNS